jgi:hypothetical protein
LTPVLKYTKVIDKVKKRKEHIYAGILVVGVGGFWGSVG